MTPPVLSPRQLETLRLRALGNHNDAIAAHLGISEQTVKNHLMEAYRKTNARCLADALRAMGWLRVP